MAQHPTQIAAILNLTSDSFSDGGQFLEADKAIARAKAAIEEGADIIDMGPASSNPDGASVSAEEEIARIKPVIDVIDAMDASTKLSLDSPLIESQRYAIARGVSMLNDIRGFPEPSFYPELAAADCELVVMHSVQASERADRRHADPGSIVELVERFFEARLSALVKAGVAESRLIVDPGMGFFLGSDRRASYAVLAALPRLRAKLGRPLYVSVSRKSFLSAPGGDTPKDRGPATLAAECLLLQHEVEYVRTHNVAALAAARRVYTEFQTAAGS